MTEEAYATRLKRAAARKKATVLAHPTVCTDPTCPTCNTKTLALIPTLKPNKYGNKKVGQYASIKEAKRAAELKLLEAAGEIRGLREQVAFELVPKQGISRPVRYVADFVFQERYAVLGHPERDGWRNVVEDVKSPATRKIAVYVLKRKLMLHVHGITVRET